MKKLYKECLSQQQESQGVALAFLTNRCLFECVNMAFHWENQIRSDSRNWSVFIENIVDTKIWTHKSKLWFSMANKYYHIGWEW